MFGSRLNGKLPLKACECKGLKWTDLGYGLGGLGPLGLEERDTASDHTFAASLLKL